jgi:D-arabinose 1-dehydrogenase-like Zn-dependent alcohol dehydrogenase
MLHLFHLQLVKIPLRTSKDTSPLINARRSLAGSGIGGIKETQRMLDFCSKYNISSDIELIPIHGVNEAYPRVVNSGCSISVCG